MIATLRLQILKEGDHSEDLSVYGRIILILILGKLSSGVDWIHLAQDRNGYRALVNTVMSICFHKRLGIS
jgi:hypothetical protein